MADRHLAVTMRHDRALYNNNYYLRPSNETLHAGLLRIQDVAAAVAYAADAASSWEEVERLMGVEGDGLEFQYCRRPNRSSEHTSKPTSRFFDNSTWLEGDTALAQVSRIFGASKRTPVLALDVGGGDGILSLALSHMGINVLCFEPAAETDVVLSHAKEKTGLDDVWLRLVSSFEDLQKQDLSLLDTVTFCSSIEHIYQEDWDSLFDLTVPCLRRNRGRLIIVNTPDHHPIVFAPPDHVVGIDDGVYDKLISKLSATVRYRFGSHLVLEFP